MKRALMAIGLGLLLCGCGPDNPAIVADEIITAFESSCSSTGPWTQVAISQSRAINSIIHSLRDKDPCKAVSGQLDHVAQLNTAAQNLMTDPTFSQFRIQEEMLQNLLLDLSQTTNLENRDQLQTAIVATQVNLANARATNTVFEENSHRDRYASATGQLFSYMQDITYNTQSLRACLEASPSAKIKIAGSLLAIGGSFAPSIYGAAAAAVGQLITSGAEFVRSGPDEKTLWALYSSRMPLALTCGLDALTEFYCQADDALTLLELQENSYYYPGAKPVALFQGLDLLGRRLPILNEWLLRVRNSSPPEDEYDLSRQNNAFKQVYKLDEVNRSVKTIIRQEAQRYREASGQNDLQKKVAVGLVKDLSFYLAGAPMNTSSETPDSGPFRNFSSDSYEYACRLVVGVDYEPCVRNHEPDPFGQGLEVFISGKILPNTMDEIAENWAFIFKAVESSVNKEFQRKITIAPEILLAEAFQQVLDNVSPREVLTMILKFMQNIDGSRNVQLPQVLADGKRVVQEVIRELDTKPTSKEDVFRKVDFIINSFHLRNDLKYINETIGFLIKWDVRDRIVRKEFPKDVEDILRSGGSDVKARLLATAYEPGKVDRDLSHAMSTTSDSIQIFANRFSQSLARSVEKLSSEAQDTGEAAEGIRRPKGKSLGQLCALLVAIKFRFDKKTWALCSQARYQSPQRDERGPLALDVAQLAQELEQKPENYRLCGWHRFLRREKLSRIMATGI